MDVQLSCPSCGKQMNILHEMSVNFCPHCGFSLGNNKKSTDTDIDEAAWLNLYQKSTDPLKRLEYLKDAAGLFPNSAAELKARQFLWENRFAAMTQMKQLADFDLQFIQTLVYCAENPGWLNRRKGDKAVREYWSKKMSIIESADLGKNQMKAIQKLIAEEFFNLIYRYLELCRKDKSFNALLFGMGKVKPTTAYNRMKNQLDLVTNRFFPQDLSKSQSASGVDYTILHQTLQLAFTQYWEDHPLRVEE